MEPKPGADARSSANGAKGSPAPEPAIAPNYRYWREHGGGWAAEYDNRKKEQVYYHIQEIMLAEYIHHHAPATVLEFGCGPGRHLRNLSRLPGIEAFGYDQSAAMVSGARAWASQDWLDAHVTIGLPTGRLPFTDAQFDIVYTAEVLVHVRPEDLEGVLRELTRVGKRQVFHLETSPQHKLVDSEHDGCWWHDLIAAYARIGKVCEMLPSGYSTHAPYRVMLDPGSPTWVWSPVFLDLCRRMDHDVSHTMDIMRGSIQGEKEARSAYANRVHEIEHARDLALEQARDQAELAAAQAREQIERLTSELTHARTEAASMSDWAHSESAARADLGVAIRLIESRLAEALSEVSIRERELNEMIQREADFVRAVDRRVWR